MSAGRLVWAAGVVVLVFASLAAVIVASALPAGYDFHAYWLAGRNLLSGDPLYPDARTILGLPDEFRYLSDILQQSNYPHDQAQRGTFDPNKLSQTPRRAALPTDTETPSEAPLRDASVSAKNFAASSMTSYSVLRRCS